VNQIQLGMLTLFLWFQKNSGKWRYGDFFSGAVLGLSLMFKPNVVFIIILLGAWWIMNRKHRKLTHVFSGIATGSVFAFIISSVFFGTPACWLGWIKVVRHLMKDYYLPINIGNTSLPMIIEEWSGYHISGQISTFLTAGILLASIVVVWMATRREEKSTPMEGSDQASNDMEFRETVLLAGLGLTIFLLSSRLVWVHYKLLIIPLALYLLGADKKEFISAEWANMIYKLLAVVAVLVIATLPVEPLYSFTSHMQRAFIAYLGMMTLFVMGLLELFYIKSRSAMNSG
jgi:cbb3-type cytochrome oxidase subunit 3